MLTLSLPELTLSVDLSLGRIVSLLLGGREMCAAALPLFRIRLRDREGAPLLFSAADASRVEELADGAIYTAFPAPCETLRVEMRIRAIEDELRFSLSAAPGCPDYAVEWVDYPLTVLPSPAKTGNAILFPYNEGALITDEWEREKISLRYTEPEYPSRGAGAVFPGMVCSQMLAYVTEDVTLYMAAHDPERGVKGIDYQPLPDGVCLRMRLFSGVNYGETFAPNYPLVWAAVSGGWEGAAERYRAWFETALPKGLSKLKDTHGLPDWYGDSPLVVAYPVRGRHDTDEITPNTFFPYENALPYLKEIKEKTGARLMALLMHWEGTAPWAPPYVWPPYGGEEGFFAFREALHREGDLLGVYCSGFGYTLQSNLIPDYNKEKECETRGLTAAMCAAPDGQVQISNICIAQRRGYDICAAAPMGHALLREAYEPLFRGGVDYAQILDQNHGGTQYFCYSAHHGHPPMPGAWMTGAMQDMLTEWNEAAKGTLFGCESAAAEPFLGNLRFSDNRFELNYRLGGVAVPLFAYLYHEYLRNFMGNQVGCPFKGKPDTLTYRLGYSFAAGDAMSLVLSPDGGLLSEWGTREFDKTPDKDTALLFIRRLTRLYHEKAKPFLLSGRMIPRPAFSSGTTTLERKDVPGLQVTVPLLHATAWQAEDGSRALLVVNPWERAVSCTVDGKALVLPPLDAQLLPL